ncbi:MAG TPA: ankyrin repeat domain-containing protein [Longimicrobiaceae bacterium]|nr:ankyrin repeat domain-containing protein [Longimicrobiaceae bacterium]
MSDERKLLEAVKAGSVDVVRGLLAQGTGVELADEQGWTPLAYAAGRGDLALVDLLLEHGADVTRTGRDQRTPLMIARASRRSEVVERLSQVERSLGVWEDPRARPFCKAYYLADLRRFEGWEDEVASEGEGGDAGEPSAEVSASQADRSIVYVHQDFTVTRSMWHGEDMILDRVSPAWEAFCRDTLAFEVPEDLL